MKHKHFLDEAIEDLSRAADVIDKQMTDEQIFDSALFFAFGVERLFKAMLVEVNPLYILDDPSFENSMEVLHSKRLHQPTLKKKQLPNRNVLTFTSAMLRAAHLCKTVHAHQGALGKLNDIRGVLVHGCRCDLNSDEVKRFLGRTFFPLVSALAVECKFELKKVVGSRKDALDKLSKRLLREEAVGEIVETLLDKHRLEWESKKDDDLNRSLAERLTKNLLDEEPSLLGRSTLDYACPACQEECVMYVEPEVEVEDGAAVIKGSYVSGLSCLFCGLEINDGEQIDYLKLHERLW